MTKIARPLSEIKKKDLSKLKAGLLSTTVGESEKEGIMLAREAADFGLSVRDYLKLSVGRDTKSDGLNGYELALYELNLPIRNDFANGVFLQAASETFQTFPGTRALFPEVIDDVVRFATRQDQFETVAPMLGNSRTIAGNEMISTIINDDSAERDSFSVPEMGRIPVRTIRTSQTSVSIFKHGSGIKTSYEFSRRASIDILVPFAARIGRELELSKVKAATSVLINGDGVNSAAGVIAQSSYDTPTGITATNGQINWAHLLAWLVARAQAGTPVDTVLMNWDAYLQWMLMFGKQTVGAATYNFGARPIENLNAAGAQLNRLDLAMNITPVLSSTMTAGRILGYSRADTMEELIEAGSNIQETERAIQNQTMTMVKTENTGYKLVYGDTRSVFRFSE